MADDHQDNSGLRARLHRQLEPSAWQAKGMSPANLVVSWLIVVAAVSGIVGTEASVRDAFPLFFGWLEVALTGAFVAEYVARVYSAGEAPEYAGWVGRLRFMRRFWPLLDLLAILPFLLTLGTANVFLVRLARLLRLLRLARLGRYTDAWDVLGRAITARRFEIAVTGGVAGLVLVLSSALLYLAEASAQPDAFGSIPRALWWSIATLTTVGYGDVAPVTAIGKSLAGMTAIAGIGLIAMPTGILAAAFSEAVQAKRVTSERWITGDTP